MQECRFSTFHIPIFSSIVPIRSPHGSTSQDSHHRSIEPVVEISCAGYLECTDNFIGRALERCSDSLQANIRRIAVGSNATSARDARVHLSVWPVLCRNCYRHPLCDFRVRRTDSMDVLCCKRSAVELIVVW